jgi:hypothetical protein
MFAGSDGSSVCHAMFAGSDGSSVCHANIPKHLCAIAIFFTAAVERSHSVLIRVRAAEARGGGVRVGKAGTFTPCADPGARS